MNRRWATMLGAATLAVCTLALPTSYAPAAEDDITAQIQNAKTAADHEAIAKHFDAKAAEATKEAADHRRMGAAYKGLSGTATGKGYAASAMPQHCEAIAKSFEAEAAHFEGMAQTHRELAKTMK